jgi:hypothetical protein
VKPRIVNFLHLRMPRQVFGDLHRVFAMLPHVRP